MTNSKKLLLLLPIFINTMLLTNSFAQIWSGTDFNGQLARTASCGEIIVKNAPVVITDNGFPLLTAYSDNYGFYSGNIGLSSNFVTIAPIFNSNPTNGVTTYDCALISAHILGNQPFTDPFTKLAADVNNDGLIDATDNTWIRRVILHISPNFIEFNSMGQSVIVNSWRFVPQYYLNQPSFLATFQQDPFSASICYKTCTVNYMDKVTLELGSGDSWDFKPFKVGDVNCSFDPFNMVAQPVDETDYLTFNNTNRLTSRVSHSRYNIQTTSNISMQREDEKTIVLKAYNTGRIAAFQMGFRFFTIRIIHK